MVERVEGFCTEAEWKRAYREINEFERQLVDFGVDPGQVLDAHQQGEQLRRFEQRTGHTLQSLEADRRGLAQPREMGQITKTAVEEMLLKTSTHHRAVDHRRGQRQVVRARQDPAHAGGSSEQGTGLSAG